MYFFTHFILFSVLFSLNWRLKYENRSVFFLYHSPFFCMVSWAIVLHRTLVSVSTCLLFIWLRVFLHRTCVFNTYVSVFLCFHLVRLNSTNYFQSWATLMDAAYKRRYSDSYKLHIVTCNRKISRKERDRIKPKDLTYKTNIELNISERWLKHGSDVLALSNVYFHLGVHCIPFVTLFLCNTLYILFTLHLSC